MSNKVSELIRKIQYLTGETLEEVAKKIGYSRPHLNKIKNSGEENTQILDLLRDRYKEILQNVPALSQAAEESAGYAGMTIPEQIALLKRHADFLEYEILQRLKDNDNLLRRIDSNLTIVKEGTIRTAHTSDSNQHADNQALTNPELVDDQVQKKVVVQSGLQQEFERKMRKAAREKGAMGRS